MPEARTLLQALQQARCLCYYPSCGTDLSNLDFFGSGGKLWSERVDACDRKAAAALLRTENSPPVDAPLHTDHSAPNAAHSATDGDNKTRKKNPTPDPDVFVHTDIQFYREFESLTDISPLEHSFHGSFEVLSSHELSILPTPNRIVSNVAHSGRCFEHTLRLWGSGKPKTLIFCLCENEAFVSQVLLAHGIHVPLIWSRNWAGGKTYGTWLPNVLNRLHTSKVYTDWLCIPGQRGEPRNQSVAEHYPELMAPAAIRLVRNPDLHWIVEGAHGWVEEFDVKNRI